MKPHLTPDERTALIHRINFVAPKLTDVGLQLLIEAANELERINGRDLSTKGLAAEQHAREQASADPYCLPDAAGVIACPSCSADVERRDTYVIGDEHAAAEPRRCVAALVTDDDSRVLLIQSAKPGRAWELPGGGVHRGETALDAAAREVHEEAGLVVWGAVCVRTMAGIPKPGASYASTIFVVTAKASGDPKPGDDAIGAGWFAADRVHDLHARGLLSDLASREDLLSWAKVEPPAERWTDAARSPMLRAPAAEAHLESLRESGPRVSVDGTSIGSIGATVARPTVLGSYLGKQSGHSYTAYRDPNGTYRVKRSDGCTESAGMTEERFEQFYEPAPVVRPVQP